MKKRLLTYGILFNALMICAQNSPPTVQWIKSNNGQQSDAETAVKSVKDNNGNYYLLANTNSDAVIAKFDNSGAAVNNFRYNEASNNTNWAYDIEVDASGNLYVCGEAFITSDWNWKPAIVKMSPTGAIVWEQIIPCTYYTNSQAQAMALDNSSNVYFVGANSDSLSVGLISASGTLLWEKKIVPAGYTIGEAFDVVVDGSNAAYVTGKIKDSVNGDYEYITFKINSSGVIVWTKILDGAAAGDDSGTNIEIDGSGNSYVTGVIADTSATNVSALLVKYNASGGQQWVKKMHMSGQTEALPGELVLDAAGNCYIAINHHTNTFDGYTRIYKYSSAGVQVYATTYSDGSYTLVESKGIRTDAVGNVFIGGTKYNGCCTKDIFSAKFNAAGTFQWNNNYNSAGSDNGVSLHLDNGNNAIVTGNGSPSGSSMDLVVVKYSSAGSFQWDGFFNGVANPADQNTKIFVQGNYSIYSMGYVNNESSNSDVLLSKYDGQGNILWQNVLDYNGNNNTPRDMDHDLNYNIGILADANSFESVVSLFDSIGSPVYTTSLASGYLHTCMHQDNSSNIYSAGGSNGTKDFCVAKVDPTGSILVQTTPATTALFEATPADLDVDNNGRFYVFGERVYDRYGANPYKKFQLQRFSAPGNILWTADVSGLDSAGYWNMYYWVAKKIIVDNTNSYVLMTGKKSGETNLCALVVKYDNNGNEVWRQKLNNNDSRSEEAVDIVLGPNNTIYVLTQLQWQNGNLYRIDRTSGSISLDQEIDYPGYALNMTAMNYAFGTGSLLLTGRGFGFSYDGDIALIKMDSSGVETWKTTVGGDYPGNDWPTGIAVTSNGRIYVSAGMMMNNGTETDAAVVKFCDIAENSLTSSGNTQNICPGNSVSLYAGTANAYQWNVAGQTNDTLQASVSGSYFCTTYKQDGCWKNTDTISVTIKNAPSAPLICQVTVDTASTHNIVYWDKTMITDADSVRIYREDVTNVYTYIGSVSVDDPGEFNDTVADPNVTTKRYKISAIDSCGNESSLSLYHNTIYIVYNGLGQFSWNPLYTIESSPNPVNNYVLMRDDSSTGNWQQVSSTAGTQSTIVDPNYNSYPSGSWRVETVWNIMCDPNRAIINTSRSNVKGQLAGPALGLEETQQVFADFAPNPFSDQTQITIRTSSGKVNCVFELYDATGRLVKTTLINSPKFILEKGELAGGVYFYSITDRESKSASNGKLLIQD
jgi:hypothetical protein